MDFVKSGQIWIMRVLLGLTLLVAFAPAALAWNSDDPAGAAAGCAVCSTFLLIPVVFFALNIALLIWVARDATARGMDSAIL